MTSISDVLKASKGLHVDDIFAQLWGRKLSGNYTIATYTGTLPATITGTKAGYLHRYKIYGNTEQNGTPTPENPIVPSECGERTENLFDVNSDKVAGYITDSGNIAQGDNEIWTYDYIDIYGGINYTYLGYKVKTALYTTIRVAWFDANKAFISRTYVLNDGVNSRTVTTPSSARYARLSIDNGIEDIAFVEGSTAPTSYIPYGYKLPLTSAGQSVDIYLGESQTTRRIRKLVLTGEEKWYINETVSTEDTIYLYTTAIATNTFVPNYSVCSHFEYKDAYHILDGNGYHLNSGYGGLRFRVMRTIANTLADFKAYLAAQYANGTPVTVWYVLATPTTGILNEPLRKIGNYADTIDSTQTTAQIPTTAGSTTISWAGSGLAPSEVELTYERK